MKNFFTWVEDNGLNLPTFTDSAKPEATDTPEGKNATAENTKRSGISQNYPDAYVRAQYPHKYFNPISSTADGKLTGKMG